MMAATPEQRASLTHVFAHPWFTEASSLAVLCPA